MKALYLIAGGTLLFAAMLAITGLVPDWRISVVLVAAAVLGTAWLFRADQRREKNEKAISAAHDEARFGELSALATSPQFELKVTGSSQLALALTLIAGGILGSAIAISSGGTLWLIVTGAALAFGALIALAAIPALGKPVISLDNAGFKSSLSPYMPWQLVEGIHLEVHRVRGRIASCSLMFLIPSLPQRISEFGVFHRLLHVFRTKSGRKRFHVVLKNTSEQPDVVYRIARSLWTRSTGRAHEWNPNMPDAFNAALRVLGEAAATPRSRTFDPSIVESGKVLADEMHRKTRILNAIVIAGLIVAAFYLVTVLLSR